jgi:hypothetical protein
MPQTSKLEIMDIADTAVIIVIEAFMVITAIKAILDIMKIY